MTTFNALGFSFLGLLMGYLPAIFPGYFPPTGLDGSNTSALWLGFMGPLVGSLGAFHCLRNEGIPLAYRLLTLRLPQLPPMEQTTPGIMLRPMAVGYLAEPERDEPQLAA
jgi:hypothetical protein